MSEHIHPSEPTDRTPPPARHRVRRVVLTGIAGAVIVGGGGAYAYASGDGGAAGTPSAPASGAPAAPAAPAEAPKHEPHIDGSVTAVSGATVTVEDPDGFTRTITTSAATTYDGVSSPLATGTRIHATGTVAGDGTSLDATAITAMPEPGQGGPPAPGRGGEDAPPAPGQHGEGAPPAPGQDGEGAPPAPGQDGEQTPPAPPAGS